MNIGKKCNYERMENMIKRFFSGILTAALAACMIQLPAAAEDSAGYYWLEAEEAACSAEYQLVENKEASGGKLMGVYETKNGEYSVEFQFENEKPGAYDIWFLSGKGTLRKISKFKWSVNDSAPAEFPSGNPVSENAVYSEYFNENDCDIYWNKIAARTTLSEGSNSVKFIVSAKTALNTELGEKAFFNMIDAAVVVPSDWKWIPDGLAKPEKPEKIDQDFIWIEAEEPDQPSKLLSASSNGDASGSKVLYASNVEPADNIMQETLGYSFTVDKAASYDIWYLGIQTNVAHLSNMKWGIDQREPETSNSVNPSDDNPTCYIANVAGGDFPVYWQKMDTQNLAAGDHTLYLQFICRNLPNASRAYVVVADSVMMVPADLGWNPNEQNLAPSKTKGELAARVFAKQHADYFNGDFSEITENLSLPETSGYKNQLDAVISYSADSFENREVIFPDGTVERPYATAEGDAKINLYINATYRDDQNKEQTGSVAIPVTVKKWNKYEVTEPIALDQTIIAGGTTVTANAGVHIHVGGADSGRAVLVMVLYDAAGRVQQMSMGEASGNGKMNVTANMQLPENVSGMSMKVYLINGFEHANRLANSLTVKG